MSFSGKVVIVTGASSGIGADAARHLAKLGAIVNISSVAGLRAFDVYTSYCISKAGLDQFTKCSAIALGPKGIRVDSVNPAMIRTPIFGSIGITKENDEQFFKDRNNDYLVGRIGEVSDTSSAIAYLASAPFITGILFPVDGGLMCSGAGAPQLNVE